MRATVSSTLSTVNMTLRRPSVFGGAIAGSISTSFGLRNFVSSSRPCPSGVRVLAAADAYQAMTQERPHRPALTPGAAAELLSSEAAQGRLDAEAARAVLEAAGHPQARAP